MERFGTVIHVSDASSNGAVNIRAQSKQLAWYLSYSINKHLMKVIDQLI